MYEESITFKGMLFLLNTISFSCSFCSLCLIVLSTSDNSDQCEVQEFVDWILFHATVCKHENVVQMLFCQTKAQPFSLILEAYSPGNLLSFLWMLRNVRLVRQLLFKSTQDTDNKQAQGKGAEICPPMIQL